LCKCGLAIRFFSPWKAKMNSSGTAGSYAWIKTTWKKKKEREEKEEEEEEEEDKITRTSTSTHARTRTTDLLSTGWR